MHPIHHPSLKPVFFPVEVIVLLLVLFFSMLIKNVPAIITTMAIIWGTDIRSPNNNDAKIIPNTEENDNTNTDLTIPILFILVRKK